MGTANHAPVNIQRADFIALVNGALGIGFLLLGGWAVLEGGMSLEAGAQTFVGFLLLAAAIYTHLRPETINQGTDPAPRVWFELAGVVVICLALTVAGGILFSNIRTAMSQEQGDPDGRTVRRDRLARGTAAAETR